MVQEVNTGFTELLVGIEQELRGDHNPVGFSRHIRDSIAELGCKEECFEFLKKKVSKKSLHLAQQTLHEASARGVQVISLFSPEYPKQLFTIHHPPLVLYVRGKIPPWNERVSVAVVGSRKCTESGRRFAKSISRELALEGALVVSGLAFGIDAAAHVGSIDACRDASLLGSASIYPGVAVLGSGVLNVTPVSNHQLAEEFLQSGGVLVSEYGLSTDARAYFFPERNRIISGLSRGVVVCEASLKSGSLITARLALEQGREVMAVPCSVENPKGAGCNMLIRDGAALVQSAADVCSILGIQTRSFGLARKSKATKNDGSEKTNSSIELFIDAEKQDLAREILLRLEEGEYYEIDKIAELLNRSTAEITQILGLLELGNTIQSLPGGIYTLNTCVDR